mgnify:CR=1 FL=1|tara:strand:+ start:1299 stop:2060 length:762 start_codon:yes stop_codon:yes gene_type:complete
MYSVLQNRKNIKFRFEKFPYLIIDDALPNDLYKKLSNTFPKYEKIIGNNEYKENFAYRYNAFNSLRDSEINSEWREFIKFHTSYEFLEEFYDVFGDSIKKIYKVEKERLFTKDNIGVRFEKNNYLNLDCQFVINTPTSGETKVIEPHLDNPVELYAALLYMKDVDDNSEGGNLTTHTFKGKPSFYGKSRVREDKINLIEEIEYKRNRLVMFLNSPYSIHGVTRRAKTNFYRKYINIIGDYNFELFNYRNFLEE